MKRAKHKLLLLCLVGRESALNLELQQHESCKMVGKTGVIESTKLRCFQVSKTLAATLLRISFYFFNKKKVREMALLQCRKLLAGAEGHFKCAHSCLLVSRGVS